MSFIATQLVGFGCGHAAPYTSFRNSYDQTADGSTLTITSVDIGTEDPTRYIVVAVGTGRGSAHTHTSATFDGDAATQHATVANGERRLSLYGLAKPTGSSMTFVVNTSSSVSNALIGVWALYNLTSTTPVTSTDTVDSVDLDLNVLSDGIVIAAIYMQDNGGAGDVVWTGVAADFARNVETNPRLFGASASTCPAATPRTVSGNISGASVIEVSGIAAAWR